MIDTGKLKDTGVLMGSKSYEPEPLKKGAEFGYWHIQHFAGKHYLCYIRRRCEK